MNRLSNSQQKPPHIAKSTTNLPSIYKTQEKALKSNSKSKKTEKLFQLIKPYNKQDSGNQSDTPLIMERLNTPTKRKSQIEMLVLTKNQNKKQFLNKQYIQQSLVGEQAIRNFYERYKKIDKARAIQNFLKQDHPITKIVDLLELHNFAPRKLDILKLKGSEAILDLRKLGLGQGSLGPVVAELVQYFGKFQSVDLSYNTIDRGLSEFLVERSKKVRNLNMCHNRIGKTGCTMFAQLFLQKSTEIVKLNLKDNNLLDNAGVYVIDNLLIYGKLKLLNLSKNLLGLKFASKMKEILLKDEVLQQLYLSWNQFGEKGTKLIFQGIQSNNFVRVFDFSWNTLSLLNAPTVAKALKSNNALYHIDLSFCGIDRNNTAIISKELQNNHSIYGLHYEGNSGTVDNRGFLRLTQKQHSEYPLPIVRGLIRQLDGIKPNPIRNEFKQSTMRDVCWICQSWQQITLRLNKSQCSNSKQCLIHLQSQNNYRAIKLNENGDCFEITRMFPIGQIRFFFTVIRSDGSREIVISGDYPRCEVKEKVSYLIGGTRLESEFSQMNRSEVEYVTDPISQNYTVNVECLPRSLEVQSSFKQKQARVVTKQKKVMIEEKLNIKFRQIDDIADTAFLNDYGNRDDDKDFLKQCLEFDIANSKIQKVIKKQEEVNAFRNTMAQYYLDFKDAYYYLANSNTNNLNIYSIPDYQFEKFLQEQKYITKRVTHAKIMVKLYSCLSQADQQSTAKKGQSNKLFNRPQFLEFLVRLTIEKWCTFIPKPKLLNKDKQLKNQQKQVKNQEKQDEDEDNNKKSKIVLPLSFQEGFQRTMKTISKYAARVRASNWRRKKYLTTEIYTVIKGYETILMLLYEKYTSGSKLKLARSKKLQGLIVLQDFKSIFIDTDIKRNPEAMKQAEPCFLDSKRLQIQDGIIQYGLNYDEFLECLARYSEFVCFPPTADQRNQLWQNQMSKKFVPLFIKMQSLIINIYRKMSDIQNSKINKIVQCGGLFVQEMQVLPSRIQQLLMKTTSNFALKLNTFQPLQEQQITLKVLVSMLKDKYKDAVVRKQHFESFQQIMLEK